MSDEVQTVYIPPDDDRTYTVSEKKVRDDFIEEYRVDYDRRAAAIRIGYGASYAHEMANKFMNEPYVLRKLKEAEQQVPPEEGADDFLKRRVMEGLMREAHYKGPGSTQSARVAALSKLASIAGMDAPIRSKTEISGPGGSQLEGVFVIPGVMSPEQWMVAAEAQQAALIASGSVEQPKK